MKTAEESLLRSSLQIVKAQETDEPFLADNASTAYARIAQAHPENVHVKSRSGCWTYRETSELVSRLANGLIHIGLKKGARIGLLMPNHPTYVIAQLAAWRAGLVTVGLNSMNPFKSLIEIGQDAGLGAIITLSNKEMTEKARQVKSSCRDCSLIIARSDADDLRFVKGHSESKTCDIGETNLATILNLAETKAASTSPQDLAAISYTGGTTGRPKGVMLTHGNFIAAARQMTAFYGTLAPGAEKFLAAAPFTHMGGLQNTINLPSSIGAQITVVERFTPSYVLDLIESEQLTFLLTIPTMLIALMHEPSFSARNWSFVRTIVAGGSPLPPETRARFEAAVGAAVRNGYGLTESTGIGAIMPSRPSDSATATGIPLPEVTIEIRDIKNPTMCVQTGSRGEVYMAGPHICAGYWENPLETSRMFDGQFLRTGDIGFIDSDGFLHVVDRLKDIIIASGFNIYPAQVEAAICEHPEVIEAMVIGVPHEYRGETVKALVRTNDGTKLSREVLDIFLKNRLSPVEMPKIVEFVDELPTTSTGKRSRAAARRSH